MRAQQGYFGITRGRIALWSAVSVIFLAVGYGLGQPAAQPYLLEMLLLTLATCFVFIAGAGLYIFMRRMKPAEKPAAVFSVCAVTLFLAAVLLIGHWIATSELGGTDSGNTSASIRLNR